MVAGHCAEPYTVRVLFLRRRRMNVGAHRQFPEQSASLPGSFCLVAPPFPKPGESMGPCLLHSGSPGTAASVRPLERTSHLLAGRAAGSWSPKVLWGFLARSSWGLARSLTGGALGRPARLERQKWGSRAGSQCPAALGERASTDRMAQPVSQSAA